MARIVKAQIDTPEDAALVAALNLAPIDEIFVDRGFSCIQGEMSLAMAVFGPDSYHKFIENQSSPETGRMSSAFDLGKGKPLLGMRWAKPFPLFWMILLSTSCESGIARPVLS